jgi:hypothetical protein
MDYLAVWFCSVHDLPGCIALLDERSPSLQQGAVLPPPHYFLNYSFDGRQLLDLKKATTHEVIIMYKVKFNFTSEIRRKRKQGTPAAVITPHS